ncbi:toll/interleukin-1 receptor domain-containing protein [Leeuwenhoekiella sp. ZYFB001]|uniref:toll/interleukin-1 receptor domain-containing protein n=1 Tax=Leeuwenhoekiella sp. ZYFB001 TaxID=2719912 RepID=UPI0014310DF9|nr:toll/interleukin-1 receptor domain-containing protein [Leeuwenhoekiella sp. ZYFB001]
MSIPKVFVSYSHDSLDHKKWVNELATKMRNNGIDAILDQWDLMPGGDLPHFMETNLENSDYILMICSEVYVKKANEGKGGVGYEKMIITSNLLQNIDQNKIIPIIRQSGTSVIPTFLKTKLYLDFSKSSQFEYSFDELIRTVHNSPLLKKPKVGNNPFKTESPLLEKKSNDGMLELISILVKYFNYSTDNYAYYANVLKESSLSRIYLDLLISEAVDHGYITLDSDGDIYLTDKGKHYAIENDLA